MSYDYEDGTEQGQKDACTILGEWLSVEPVWLYHIMATYGKCECRHDNELGDDYCETWRQTEDLQYKEFYGLTREQHLQRLRERAVRERELQKRLEEGRARAQRMTVEEHAREQGIDPRLLPD